ncbi:unnamed protein product [Musa hybrid cultivar]
MGNCIKLQKPVTWVDDDDDFWESMEHNKKDHGEVFMAPVKEKGGCGRSTEVRIKISKKQLEELLRQDDGNGLPLRQVLAGLLCYREGEWGVSAPPLMDIGIFSIIIIKKNKENMCPVPVVGEGEEQKTKEKYEAAPSAKHRNESHCLLPMLELLHELLINTNSTPSQLLQPRPNLDLKPGDHHSWK